MKSKNMKQDPSVETLDAMTDTAVMALVDWVAMTGQNGAMLNLVYGLLMVRQAREGKRGAVSGEELAFALGKVTDGALGLAGRIWGREGNGLLKVLVNGAIRTEELVEK